MNSSYILGISFIAFLVILGVGIVIFYPRKSDTDQETRAKIVREVQSLLPNEVSRVQSWNLSKEQTEALSCVAMIMDKYFDNDDLDSLHNEIDFKHFDGIIQVIKNREVFDDVRNNLEIDNWVFGTLINYLGNKLARGDFHISRGTLSPEGESTLDLFDFLQDEGVKAGCSYLKEDGKKHRMTEKFATTQKETIRQEIEEAG